MLRLNFTCARLLTEEFRKRYAAFIMKTQAGRLVSKDQVYLCHKFGMEVEDGLRIEIELRPIANDCELAKTAVELPEPGYTGTYGTVPVLYIFK